MARKRCIQPNPPAISISSLRACYAEIQRRGTVRKCQIVQMLNYKSNGADGLLLRFESAGLLLSEDPETGEVRAWE